jgi:hypothetical protein
VLDPAVDLDVDHARLVADRLPGVDVAGRLVHVHAGADDPVGVDELPLPRQVEPVDLAGVAVPILLELSRRR